jgi:hypothetical protein
VLAFVFAVLAILIASAIVAGVKWLIVPGNRESLRRRVCRHDWVEADNTPIRPNVIFVHDYAARCSKCGETR